jgi:RNA polymerase sigma factor (sigma-70 family)
MLAKGHPETSGRNVTDRNQFKGKGLDDKYLWQSIREDNELSFSILYKKYTKLLYNYGMQSCHDYDLVMDCLQELFASLWDNRKNSANVYAVNAYLFKSFRRLLVKKLVWRKRFSLSLENKDDRYFEIVLPVEYSMEKDEFEAERLEKLSKCMSTLTKRQREALFLKFYNNLNYNDIASIMELQVDSVYNIISKALDCLRHQITTGSWIWVIAMLSL